MITCRHAQSWCQGRGRDSKSGTPIMRHGLMEPCDNALMRNLVASRSGGRVFILLFVMSYKNKCAITQCDWTASGKGIGVG